MVSPIVREVAAHAVEQERVALGLVEEWIAGVWVDEYAVGQRGRESVQARGQGAVDL